MITRNTLFALLLYPCIARAEGVPDIGQLPPSARKSSQPLSAKEKRGADLAKSWIEKKSLPVREEDGKVVFLFGSTLPSVICSPLNVCDIELEPGEKVKNVYLGDTPRWKVRPATSGIAPSEVTHVIVKPVETGLRTAMIVTTDRRTYHIQLVSQDTMWMPRVGFTYQTDIEREWKNYYGDQIAQAEKRTIPETKENIETLNFDYTITGDAPWKPVRVYNDGVKTIIQMPQAMAQTEAPALLVIGTDGTEQIVNYRLKKDRFIVDQIFSEAALIAGVGDSQVRVTISKGAAQEISSTGRR